MLRGPERYMPDPGRAVLFSDPTDCSKFYNCGHGVPHLTSCGPGTLWNDQIKVCDWPQNVNCSSGTPIHSESLTGSPVSGPLKYWRSNNNNKIIISTCM